MILIRRKIGRFIQILQVYLFPAVCKRNICFVCGDVCKGNYYINVDTVYPL